MKSANLKILQKLGYNVPRFTIIPSSVFSSVYESYLHSFAIGDGHTPDQFDNFISRVELDEVSKIINKINFSPKYQTWAIRSSSSMEDSSKYSFAGLFESKLDVNTADILKSVREVYLSLFSNRVEAYLVENNINNRNLNMSIIIQEFIPGDISGVMFSIAGNQPDKIAISVTQGLGDKLVSGQIEGEYYLIDRNQEQINISIAPYISIDQLNELRKTILLLENAFESLLDVEFTYKDGILYLLQVRPITVFPSTGIVKRTFDNSNIIESYKGPTTPLTYSVATRSYAKVYYLFLKNMGVKQSILKSNDETFDNLIVYLSGNIYYNLNNWHAGLQLLPGYEYNKEYMDTMMGLGEKFELEKTNKNLAFMYKENKPPGKLNQLIYRPIHNIRLGVNIFKHHRKLEKEIRYFMDDFKKKMEMLTSLNIHTLSIEEIIEIDTYVYQEITSKWFAPILNDFFLMIYFGIFKKLNEKWIDTPRYNELLSGNSDLLS
ncbi:MAG: hypothetical protein OEZ01_09895, partial [Candidatus Heimdallarchaeota archaeon]|nr:hypothetical protein [Candidatus Heimdallarchaeota archaeon]